MNALKLAIIGCGRPRQTSGATGYGMSHVHMLGYKRCPNVSLTAVADINPENGKAFAAEYGAGVANYTDYRQMLAEARPDVVSITTWVNLHAEMVIAAAEAGVKAIHCEKPMALTFADAKKMVEVCESHRTQLTFNHQRRFNGSFRKIRELLRSGAIGDLLRIELHVMNLLEWGTHYVDLISFYNHDTPADWVLAQIDPRNHRMVFGVPCESQSLTHIKYRNNVRVTIVGGHDADLTHDARQRLVGTKGQIEITEWEANSARMWTAGSSNWQEIDIPTDNDPNESTARAVENAIHSLRTGEEPECSARRALAATEIIFAAYESANRKQRIDLPLTFDARGFVPA
jgi:UDP-N-acetylglucosamine 3-dehydrogenase